MLPNEASRKCTGASWVELGQMVTETEECHCHASGAPALKDENSLSRFRIGRCNRSSPTHSSILRAIEPPFQL